jgi:hypothetical protein
VPSNSPQGTSISGIAVKAILDTDCYKALSPVFKYRSKGWAQRRWRALWAGILHEMTTMPTLFYVGQCNLLYYLDFFSLILLRKISRSFDERSKEKEVIFFGRGLCKVDCGVYSI